MFDEKKSDQASVISDSSDDEVIIDLTDEILVNTEDANDNLELSDNLADDAQLDIEDDEESEIAENEEFLTPDETENSDNLADDAQLDIEDDQESEVAEDEEFLTPDETENSDNLADDAQLDIEDDQESEVAEDEEFLTPDETENVDLQRDEVIVNLDDQVAEDQDEISDDQLITSALYSSLGTKDDETEEVTEEYDLNSLDEDEITIVDHTRDEADENISTMAGNDIAQAQMDEDVFDLEEEIELDYESDDEEDEFIELDDERTEDNQGFVDLMLGESNKSDQSADDEEPGEYLEFETEDKDDVIVLDADRNQDTEVIALADEDTPQLDGGVDLPDIEADSELDFEDEEDVLALDEPESDSNGGIIERAVEQSLGLDDDRDQINLVDETEFGIEDDDAITDLNGSPEDDDEILALAEEEPLKFADDELLDLDEGLDIEADDEVIPLDGFKDLEAEDGEEVIEIAEFDQHFPAESEALLKKSGILDASGTDEEDFLELIDVDEDRSFDDEEIVEFSDSPEDTDDDKKNQFFSDNLEEDQPEPLTPESIFSDDLEDLSLENDVTESILDDSAEIKSELDDEILAVVKKAHDVSPESTTDADNPISEDENFDFDSSSVAQQVDRLDMFLAEDTSDEPEVASLAVDQVAEEEKKETVETGLDSPQIEQDLDGLPAIPAGQIDAAIERIINEKFSSKIEGIIYEVIEKAVTKEIDRLKGALTGSNTVDD